MFQYSLKKPTWQLRLTKGLTIIAGITMVFNMSALGVLIAPTKAYAAIQYTLEGQQKDLTFTTGNICGGSGGCFAEGENVPFKLTIAGLTDGKTYSAKIQHDYKDSAGVEGYVNFNTPGTWNGSASSVSLSSPTTSAGLPNTKTYTITFTATSSTVQLKWNALLSQNAGEWNGAQLHARLVKGVQQESIGNKEVPIQPDKIIIRTLGIAKSDNPDPINLNAQTTYTIVVTNTGEQDETVTVVDTLPAQMVYVTDSANPAPTSVVGSVITWSGIVLAKTSGSRTITFNATGAKNGTWTNTASISAVGLDPKSDTEPTTVLGQCVPTISKSVQNITHPAGPNMPGDILEYTIFYQNTGSANCTGGGVRVNDTIPTGLTYNGTHSQTTGTDYGYQYNEFGTANPNPQAGASMVSWNANILTPKESGTVTFQTTINSVPECQSAKITNVAKMYGDQFSSGITSNEVITDVTASCPSTLTVIKHVDNTNGGTATSANWTMHVAKANTDVFTFAGTENPGITKTLDAGTYNVSETNGPVNYALTYSGDCDANGNITIANGEHKTCTLTNAYTPYCGDGIVNQASEQCDDGNTNNTDECSNTCQIQSCNMIIEKFVSDNDETLVKSNTASVGETLTYTLKYKNIGNAYCTGGGVRVDDTIPAGTTYTGWHTGEFNSAEPSSEAYYGYTENLFGTANPNPQAGASMVSWNAGYVQPNEQGTLKFTVTVDPLAACQELNINNKGIVYADQIPGGVWSNEVTTHVAADCYGKLKVKKIVDAGTMTPDSWSFTVGTTTLTPAAGTDYVVFDLPAGTYSATENTIAGYHQVSNSCENVPVVPNETAECQIHNTQDVGQLTVIKHVAGSTEPAASWTMNVAGTTPLSFAGSEAGTTNTVVAGNYTVTETKTGPAGYTLSYSGDCDASGKVTIANGDNKTCTLTNTRDIGSIKVIKNVDTDGDGDVDIAGATDWTWDISGGQQNIATGSSATVDTGDYTINEDQKTNFHVVSLVCGTQDLGATESATISVAKDQNVVCTFTNALDTGRVDGYKFEDMNGNGTWDAGEPVIQGVEIKLSNGWTDTTDVNGYYSFELVPTGTYSLEETIDANWINTTPNPVTNVAVTKDNTTSVNFGNFELGRIYGTKWNDLNGDYLNTDGDQSIQGWYICLNGQTNCVVTDENGNYEFTGLTAGHYSVTETILPGSGWTPTFPLTSYEIDIVSGSNEKADFFNFQLGKISGYKWNDLNGDGKWDAGEPGIEGWTINLWKDAGVAPFETVTTDNTGRYEFDGLLHGSYVVTEGSRTGWTLTSPDNHYGPLVVTSGSVFDKDNNFGNFKNVNINAYKFNDVDGDGVKDAEDLPIKDWKMYLDGGQEKLTDVNGMVTWTVTTGGDYTVSEGDVADWTHTNANSVVVSVQSGDQDKVVNFLNFKNGTITGYKFEDVNNDGKWLSTQSGEENGLEGWTINLWSDDNGAPGVILKSTITDKFGYFEFNGLTAGDYWLSETLQNGWYQYFPTSGMQINSTYAHGPITIISGYNNTGSCDSTEPVDCFLFGNAERVTLELDKWNNQEVAHGGDGIAETTETINYQIDWSISGNSIAQNVVLVDTIPAELNIDTNSITASDGVTVGVWDPNTKTITWDFGTQQPGAKGHVNYSATVITPIADGTPIVNVAKISADNSDPKFKEDDSKVAVESLPVMVIEKSVDLGNDLGFVNPGDTVTYTVVVTNTGTDTLKNVKLSDTLPDGFLFLDTLTPTHEFSLGDIAAGKSVTTTYEVIVGADVLAGNYDNLAVATADNHTPVDDTATVEVRVPTPHGDETNPKLSIDKTVNVQFANPGDTIEYTVVLKNTGDAQALNVTLTDTLPTGFTFEDGKSTKTWNVGSIDVNGSWTITYKVKIAKTVTAGEYENLAMAKASNHNPIQDRAQVEVRIPKVLGDSVPDTGAGIKDYAIFIASLLMIIAGALFIYEGRKRAQVANKNQ